MPTEHFFIHHNEEKSEETIYKSDNFFFHMPTHKGQNVLLKNAEHCTEQMTQITKRNIQLKSSKRLENIIYMYAD